MEAVDVVQPAVPRFGHDWQRPGNFTAGAQTDLVGHQRLVDGADAVGVGQPDRRRQLAALADPFQAGHLAVAVEPVGRGEDWLAGYVAVVREQDRHTGTDRAAANAQRPVARDERAVPDADAL